MGQQQTLRNKINCTGVGLHTGESAKLSMRPAQAGTGIIFRRSDLDPERAVIPARYDLVSSTEFGTTLTNEHGASIATVEHVLAALAGCGVSNAIVDVNGPEVPIMDGSAAPFVFLIQCAGVKVLNEPAREVRVLKPITVKDGDKWARLEPYGGFAIEVEIDFPTEVIKRQSCRFTAGQESFADKLANARTFGFLKDVSVMRSKGFALGGSLDNSIVIDDDRVLNESGLRYPDEFARHKALDVLGDLSLAGVRLQGLLTAYKPGHGLNNAILRALFADPTAWTEVAEPRRAMLPVAEEAAPVAVNF